MLTIGDYQLIGYFDASGDICLVRRHLLTSEFEYKVVANPMKKEALGDAHRALNLAYSADGIIHAVFGAHGDQPFYYQLRWPDLVVLSRDATRLNLTSERITYPQFYNVNHHLIMLYRDDALRAYSINRYNAETGSWSQWLPSFLTTPSDMRSVYLNDLGIQGEIFAIAYTLRLPDTQHYVLNQDLRVIISRDAGATWYSFDGAALSLPIVADHPSVAVHILAGRNLCNQAGAWLGPDQVLRVVYYADDEQRIPQVFVGEFNLRTGELGISRLTDRVSDFELMGLGTLHSLPLSRPVILGVSDQIVVIWRQDSTVVTATRPYRVRSATWRKTALFSGDLKNWEPIVDFTRTSSGVITLFIQSAEQGEADTNFHEPISAPVSLYDVVLVTSHTMEQGAGLAH